MLFDENLVRPRNRGDVARLQNGVAIGIDQACFLAARAR